MHVLALGAAVLTLVSTHAPVTAVAQDGARIAWSTPGGVYSRLLPAGRVTRVATAGGAVTGLAVAGDRLAWATRGNRVEFGRAQAGVAVPAAMQFSGVVTSLVGQGSLLGFTVVTPTQDPSMCEDNMCPSMAGSSIGYVVQGSRITELANGTQPRSLLPVVPLPVVQRDPSTLVVSGSHRTVHVPAAAQVIPTTKGAVVLAGRTLFVVTPRVPKLVPVGHTSGRAAGFSAAGARVVWAETLDAKHGRVRAIVVR